MQLLGSVHHRTASFHPQANGMVERFHRSLKAALRARLSGPHWIDELPWALLGVRTAPKEDLQASSAELVYGSPLVVPGDLIVPPSTIPQACTFLPLLRQKVGHLVPTPASHHCVSVSRSRHLCAPVSLCFCVEMHTVHLFNGLMKVPSRCSCMETRLSKFRGATVPKSSRLTD